MSLSGPHLCWWGGFAHGFKQVDFLNNLASSQFQPKYFSCHFSYEQEDDRLSLGCSRGDSA